MTRAEYLEHVQERLGFPQTGVGSPSPDSILYDHHDVVQRLREAHERYCADVALILELPHIPLGHVQCQTDTAYDRVPFKGDHLTIGFITDSEGGSVD